jgi:hypothetical protein
MIWENANTSESSYSVHKLENIKRIGIRKKEVKTWSSRFKVIRLESVSLNLNFFGKKCKYCCVSQWNFLQLNFGNIFVVTIRNMSCTFVSSLDPLCLQVTTKK